MKSRRLILAVRKLSMPEPLSVSGFHPLNPDEIAPALSAVGLWLGPRSELEIDESFRQLIPYIVLVRGTDVVCYRRTTSGGEQRLHGLLSIGVGGHIELDDVVVQGEQIDLKRTLQAAAQREIVEEVGDIRVLDRRWVGLLVDDGSPVGRVHLGIVGIWVIADTMVRAAEDALREVQQVPIAGLQRVAPELETWSAMLAPHLESFVHNAR